jgi:hypothetical protein
VLPQQSFDWQIRKVDLCGAILSSFPPKRHGRQWCNPSIRFYSSATSRLPLQGRLFRQVHQIGSKPGHLFKAWNCRSINFPINKYQRLSISDQIDGQLFSRRDIAKWLLLVISDALGCPSRCRTSRGLALRQTTVSRLELIRIVSGHTGQLFTPLKQGVRSTPDRLKQRSYIISSERSSSLSPDQKTASGRLFAAARVRITNPPRLMRGIRLPCAPQINLAPETPSFRFATQHIL